MRACVGAKGRELVSGVRGVKGVVEVRALPSSFNSRGSREHREQAERLAASASRKLGNLSSSFLNLKSVKVSCACALLHGDLERSFWKRFFFFWDNRFLEEERKKERKRYDFHARWEIFVNALQRTIRFPRGRSKRVS